MILSGRRAWQLSEDAGKVPMLALFALSAMLAVCLHQDRTNRLQHEAIEFLKRNCMPSRYSF